MAWAAPAPSSAADSRPVPPHYRGSHQRRPNAEGKQGHELQEQDDQGEDAAADTTTPSDSEDTCACSYHLYHRLSTYPLEEVRLPTAQVGGAAIDVCVRNVVEMLTPRTM